MANSYREVSFHQLETPRNCHWSSQRVGNLGYHSSLQFAHWYLWEIRLWNQEKDYCILCRCEHRGLRDFQRNPQWSCQGDRLISQYPIRFPSPSLELARWLPNRLHGRRNRLQHQPGLRHIKMQGNRRRRVRNHSRHRSLRLSRRRLLGRWRQRHCQLP